MAFDNLGNLYGTAGGGAYSGGVAYELSPSQDGSWAITILYNFGSGNDGSAPKCNLVFDRAGNLYGTTEFGGTQNAGTVFKMSLGANGWTETVLYSFTGHIYGPDGNGPIGGVVMDNQGNLYGATKFGGTNGGYGTVYQLSPSKGGYVERLIHSFNGYDGWELTSGITMDSRNRIYGTTSAGGTVGYGTIFQLSRDTADGWNISVLDSLNGSDGSSAVGPPVFDRTGNVYVATQFGGLKTNAGSVLRLSPTVGGPWKETVLHLFTYPRNGDDGQSPYAGVIILRGQLFGTTLSGGINDAGTVFTISRAGLRPISSHHTLH